jgi:hypothetical protein
MENTQWYIDMGYSQEDAEYIAMVEQEQANTEE